jgi:hypothetical protein
MSVATNNLGQVPNASRRSYISTAPFYNDFFTYTVTMNPTTYVKAGTLTAVTTTQALCPANRILVENGKKLYPSGIITAGDTTNGVGPYSGVKTYMVGVFDSVSFLNGFIDPNSKIFAIYNTDKPDYVPRGVNPNGDTEVDKGAPVFTLGTITGNSETIVGSGIASGTPSLTVSSGDVTVTSGNVNVTAGNVVVTSGVVRCNTLTTPSNFTTAGPTYTINAALGQVWKLTCATGASGTLTLSSSNLAVGQVVYVILINTSGVTISVADDSNATVQMGAAQSVLTGETYTISFVSDGIKLYQLSTVKSA